MAQQFKNNARALLVSSINSSVTSFVIESAKADLFPVADVGSSSLPSANSWFKATLQDSSGAVEIVAVRTRTAGSGVCSNVIRGYEGTTALSFVAGTVVGLRITAADVQTALDLPGQNSVFTGDNSFTGTNSFTGATTAATQTYGDSSTALATTAFVQTALQALHPVGSIYINATNATNPGTLLGFGTWTAFGAGRVPVGFNSSNALFDTAEETGGSADAITVSHNHTASSSVSDPGHAHGPAAGQFVYTNAGGYESAGGGGFISGGIRSSTTASASTGISVTTTVASTGSSGTNANYQPYITVYMWKRTA